MPISLSISVVGSHQPDVTRGSSTGGAAVRAASHHEVHDVLPIVGQP